MVLSGGSHESNEVFPTPQEKNRMYVHLVDSKSLQTIYLPRLPAIIGRDAEVDVRLADPLVTPFHCFLGRREGPALHVWSLREDGCTMVNGRRVEDAKVLPGDRLVIGGTEFIVEYEMHRYRETPEPCAASC
jgi:pSer/pThr/pTyr-binding forkhead associated (FHA) protein